MRRKTIKLSAAVVLSAGILLSLVAGITYATEAKTEPYGDHQELQIPVYEDSTDVWADYVEPADLDGLKSIVTDPESNVAAIAVNAEMITSAVTVERPVHLDVVGYDALSPSDQKDVKIKLDFSESESIGGFMVIRGLPREQVEVIDQGTTVLYWEQQSAPIDVLETPLKEEPVSPDANAEPEASSSSSEAAAE